MRFSVFPAVAWDMNGVLVDDEWLHVEKLMAITQKYGIVLREKDFTQTHSFDIPDGQGGMRRASMKLHGAGDKNIYWWAAAQNNRLTEELSQKS